MPNGDKYNLPGSKSWFSKSEIGNIHFQEKQVGPFILRHSILQFARKITLYFKSQSPLAGVHIALGNSWQLGLQGEKTVTIKQNQFVLLSPGSKGEKMVFEKNLEYRGFEILCPQEKMAELMDIFPGIAEFVGNEEEDSVFLQKKPLWAPDTALDMLNGQEDFNSEDRLILLLKFFLLRVGDLMEVQLPTKVEVELVGKAEKLIMKDISVHYPIPVIAKKVKLNEYRLKYVFRHIFKKSIFQYLLRARMEKAKELLKRTKKPLEEIARLTGYRFLTSFIHAFHKYYKYTPRSVRKPGR
jgi:AraC-like DNA-binding protein